MYLRSLAGVVIDLRC